MTRRSVLAAIVFGVLTQLSCGGSDSKSPATAPSVATKLVLTVGPSSLANDRAAFAAQPVVQLQDADGAAVATAGVAVTVSVTAGGGTIGGTATATTSGAGTATFSGLSLAGTAGAHTLTFSASGVTSAVAVVNLAAGAATTLAASGGNNQTAVAGAAVATAPSVVVTDLDANPVTGVAVAFAVATGGGSVTGASATTNASGIATVGSWTLGGSAGTNTMTATSAGLTGSPTTFTATGTAAAAAKLTLTTSPGVSAASGATFATQPVVQLRDANNNAVALAGVAVTAGITSGGGTLGGTATATTSSAGVAAFTNLSITGTAGARTVTFSAPGLTSTAATVTITPGAATTIAVSGGNNQSAAVNAAVATAPSVLVTDASANPVSGVAVTFAIATGSGSVTGGSATTNASGVATVGSWTLGPTAGSNTMTATSTGLAGSPVTFTATGTVSGSAHLSLTTSPTASPKNRIAFAAQPVVQLQDASNANVAAAGVVVTASITAGGGTLGGTTTATTSSGGVATFTDLKISGTVGARSLTFTASGYDGIGASVTVIAGDATTIAIDAGNSQTAQPGAAVTTAPSVLVTDADANPVSGVAVTFAVASGGGSLTGASATTSTSGIAAVGSWTLGGVAGANTITATSAGLSGSPVTFSATGVATPATKLALTTSPSASAANGAPFGTQPVVQLQDASSGAVSSGGIVVTAAITAGGGTLGGTVTATTSGSGAATFTDLSITGATGDRTLTFAASGLTSVTATVTITPGAATAIAVNGGNNQSAVAGAAVATAPSVVVSDASGNPVSGTSVTFAVASGGGSVTGGSASSNASGIASVGSWTLGTTAGANTMTATSSGLTGSPLTFNATGTAGAAATLSKQAGDNQSATVNTAVATAPSVKLADAHGNGVAGVNVTFAVASGGGSVTGGTQMTNGSGMATLGSWTLGSGAGANTLTASSIGVTSVTFSATGTSVAASKMQFCSGQVPVWLAYRDGTSGAWTQATNNGDNSFNVSIGTLGAVSWVWDFGNGYISHYTYFVTKSEVPYVGATCPTTGTRTLNGSVAGTSGSEVTNVYFADGSKAVTGNASFAMTGLSNGTFDVLATRLPDASSYTPNKYIIRRTQNPGDGATIPVLDFGAVEAQTPANSTLTLAGVGTGTYQAYVLLTTSGGARAFTAFATGTGAGSDILIPYNALPATLRDAGDSYYASASISTTTSSKIALQRFTSFGDRTAPFGAALLTPTVTQIATSPSRLRVQLPSQADYAAGVAGSFASGTKVATVYVTAAYVGGTPATWDFSVPDVSSAGFQSTWGLSAGAITWIVTANGDGTAYANGSSESPYLFASQSSSISATMQVLPTGEKQLRMPLGGQVRIVPFPRIGPYRRP